MIRFSEQQTYKFVKLYGYYELLWNPNHDNYKNKRMKDIACENMARVMNIKGFTRHDVRQKLKSLRGTYNIETQKMKKLADQGYETNLKWLPVMASFLQRIGNPQAPADWTSEKADDATGDIFEESQWENSLSNSDIESVEISPVPSMSSEPELEHSIGSTAGNEIITVTPEIHAYQSVANSTVYTVIPEVQTVSHSQASTITPEIITVKADTNPKLPVTLVSGSARSVSSPTELSGIQNVPSTSSPKLFAIVPEGQAFDSGSKHSYIAISSEGNNAKCVRGSQVIQKRTKQVLTNGTRKRPHEEVTSTNSNDDNRQIHQVTVLDNDFSDGNEDEMDAFGHFVALNLRKMSMQSSLSAQTEILSVLTRHRLNDSTVNQPQKQIGPYILTNNNSPTHNPVLQKVILKR